VSASGSRSVVRVAPIQAVSSTAQRTSRRSASSRSPSAASRSRPNARSVSSIRYRVPPVNVTSSMDAVDETGQDAARVAAAALFLGELLGGVEVHAVDEDREVTEQPLFVLVEELVGPLDGGPQRLVAGLAAWAATTEEVEGPVQAGVQIGEGERRQPPGGELDGQRHAVEAADDVGDKPQLGRRRTAGADPSGPVEEDRDGRGP
jgi:hypothetical protein